MKTIVLWILLCFLTLNLHAQCTNNGNVPSIIEGNDVTVTTTGENATYTMLYVLVDPSTGQVVMSNNTGTFSTTGLTVGVTYEVYGLNYDPNDPPSGLPIGAGSMLSSITGGCFNTSDFTTEYVCFTVASATCVANSTVCEGAPVIAVTTGNNTALTTVYVLVDVATGLVVASNSTGDFTADVSAPNSYQVHVLNYDTANPPSPLPINAGDDPTTIGATDMGCYDSDFLTEYVCFTIESCGCVESSTVCEGDPVIAVTTGNNTTLTTVYVLVDATTGLVVASNSTGDFTADVSANNSYQVHVLNYDPADAPSPLPVNAGDDPTTIGATNMGCYDSDFLTEYVCFTVQFCGCVESSTVCEGDPVVAVTTGNNTTLTTVYVLVDPTTGLVVASNSTGDFTADVSAPNSYQVHVLNYDPADPPSPLPINAGDDPTTIGATNMGCYDDDFLTEYLCFTINPVPDLSATGPFQNVCPSLTVDITNVVTDNNAVATPTITYWTDMAATTAFTGNPAAVATSQTIYVQYAVGTNPVCSDIIAVDVVIVTCAVDCPTVAVTDVSPIVCDGGLGSELGDWQTAVAAANPVADPDNTSTGIVYSSTDLGATTTTTPDGDVSAITGTHSGIDNCEIEAQTVYAYLGCDEDNPSDGITDSYQLVGTFTLSVYPDIASQANVVNNDGGCGPSLTLACTTDYTVTNDYDGSGANPNFSAENGAGNVTFTVSLNNAPAGLGAACISNTYTAAYDCTEPSVSIDKNDADNSDDTQTIPVGGTATFTITVTNNGTEDLCNVAVTDPNGASCEMTYTANAGVLAVGESWTYTCTVTNVIDNFTNTAFVTAEGCNSTSGVTDNDLTQVIVTCPAFAGGATASLLCPSEDATATVSGYYDGAGFETWVIVTDNLGIIVGTFPVDANGEVSIPYSFWADQDENYFIYSFNYDTNVPPDPMPMVGSNIVMIGTVSEGCFDRSTTGSLLYVPTPLAVDCDEQPDEGDNGGITPFYYNSHEICISGGTPPYDYWWSTTGYVRHAILGTGEIKILYSDHAVWAVTVTDANGCSDQSWEFTNDPSAVGGAGSILDIYADIVTPSSTCNGATGSVEIFVEGGTPPYTYDWSGPFTWNGTGQGTNMITEVPQGWYTVVVTDAAGDTTQDWYWVHCNFSYTAPDGSQLIGRGKVTDITRDADIGAYPNPFSQETTIEFGVNETENISIVLYAIDGKQISQLFRGQARAGEVYTLPFKAGRLPAGVYMLRLNTETGKMKHTKLFVSP